MPQNIPHFLVLTKKRWSCTLKEQDSMKSMQRIIFITKNKYKFQIAKKLLEGSGLKLIQRKLDTPEIQSDSLEKIAEYSARWASSVLNSPVVVSDVGCFIEALKGFPGPFIKYINQWLSMADMLRLMKGKTNRRIVWKECIAYCEPGKKPVSLCATVSGKISKTVGKNLYRKTYGGTDAIFIPEGHIKPASEIPTNEYVDLWSKNDNWKRLAAQLQKSRGRAHKTLT